MIRINIGTFFTEKKNNVSVLCPLDVKGFIKEVGVYHEREKYVSKRESYGNVKRRNRIFVNKSCIVVIQ